MQHKAIDLASVTGRDTVLPAVPRGRRIPLAHLVYAALFVLFALYVRAPYLGDPAPDYDEQLYQLIGQQILHGAIPFVDIWDRKPIGLFLIYAAANLVGGSGVWPYQLLALSCTILAAVQIFYLARYVADDVGAAAASLLYIIYLSAYGSYVGQSEVFFIPLLLFMTSQAVRLTTTRDLNEIARRSIRIMIAGGLCLQIKYTVAPQCAYFGLICLGRLWQLGTPIKVLAARSAIFALIGLAPTLLVATVFAGMGQFDAFAFANFKSIALRGALSGELKELYRLQVAVMALPLLIVAAFGAFKLYMSGKRCSPVYLVAAGWTASALVSAVMVGNIYIHYFAPVVPGLAILASPAFVQSRLGAMLASFAILSGLLFFNPAHHHQISAMSRSGFAGVVKLATPFVGSQRDCLYVFDGPTALYRETHSCLPGRFVYPDHLNNAQEASALGVDTAAEVARILANRPSVIVTASKPVVPTYNAATAALVNRAVARDYVRMGTFRYFPRRLIVHVRRDLLYRATARRREGLSGGS